MLITKVKKKEELTAAIETAFKESNEVLIEAFMSGREVACCVMKTKNKKLVLPVTEIISKNEFFDYEAKYTPGKSEEVTPANIPEPVTEEIQRLSLLVYDLLGCKGIVLAHCDQTVNLFSGFNRLGTRGLNAFTLDNCPAQIPDGRSTQCLIAAEFIS